MRLQCTRCGNIYPSFNYICSSCGTGCVNAVVIPDDQTSTAMSKPEMVSEAIDLSEYEEPSYPEYASSLKDTVEGFYRSLRSKLL